MPLISIIIRTRNEERWVGRCLQMINRQTFKDWEVIVVDNKSTDHTLDIVQKYPVKLLNIDDFTPGKAINQGILVSSGKYLVCVSAHCIPKDEHWLENLLRNMESEKIAGVYGRQLPFAYSSDLDKRDLLITFGLDHRIQIKDSFFHNANSMIRRSVWGKVPFDESATNIEDRIWGKAVIEAGYQIAYEPQAAVYHYHGIHQGADESRAKNVVRIMESLENLPPYETIPYGFRPDTINILAVLPVLGEVITVAGQNLLERAVKQVQKSRYVQALAVISESVEVRGALKQQGITCIQRPSHLLQPKVGVEEVLEYTLKHCEEGQKHFDAVLFVNYLYPFRPENFFDKLVEEFTLSGVDTLVPTLKEFHPHWVESEGKLTRIDSGLLPRQYKSPIQKGIVGLGCITSSEFIRRQVLLGDNVGLVPFENPLYALRASDFFDRTVIEMNLKNQEVGSYD